MAASNSNSVLIPLLIILMSIISLRSAESVELDVGGDVGWAIPSQKNDQFYNDWASKNRFQINDTLHFKYSKDSVMAVTVDEYEKCRSAHPVFFSNNGDTVYTLDQPGLFYFISGVAGHCDRGLKMIVKVLDTGAPPPPPDTSSSHTSAAVAAAVIHVLTTFVVVVSSSLAGLVFMSFF